MGDSRASCIRTWKGVWESDGAHPRNSSLLGWDSPRRVEKISQVNEEPLYESPKEGRRGNKVVNRGLFACIPSLLLMALFYFPGPKIESVNFLSTDFKFEH